MCTFSVDQGHSIKFTFSVYWLSWLDLSQNTLCSLDFLSVVVNTYLLPEVKAQQNADIHPSKFWTRLTFKSVADVCWCIHCKRQSRQRVIIPPLWDYFTNGKSQVTIHLHSQKYIMPCQHINKEDVIDKISEEGIISDFWLLYHVLSSVPGQELHLTTHHTDLLKQASGPDHDHAYHTKTLEQTHQENLGFTLSWKNSFLPSQKVKNLTASKQCICIRIRKKDEIKGQSPGDSCKWTNAGIISLIYGSRWRTCWPRILYNPKL